MKANLYEFLDSVIAYTNKKYGTTLLVVYSYKSSMNDPKAHVHHVDSSGNLYIKTFCVENTEEEVYEYINLVIKDRE